MRNLLSIYILVIFGLFMNMVSANEYSEGQIWKYKTRKGEENSLLFIVKVDNEKGYGNIYHIYIDGLKIKNPHISSGIQNQLPHAPVDDKTLSESVTALVSKTSNSPDISEGYKSWRESFDKGEAGVFNIPASKIIQYIEDVVNQRK